MTKYLVIGFVLLNIAALAFAFFYFQPRPFLVSPDTTFEDVAIQSTEAIELARPYLLEDALRTSEDHNEEAVIVIVRKGSWYYLSETNRLDDEIESYLSPAVGVHVDSGEVIIVE
jgi:hypothetical protein